MRLPGLPGNATASRRGAIAPLYEQVVGWRGRRAHLAAAILGVGSVLAFPPFFFWPALIVGLTGMIWLLDGASLTERPGRAAFARMFAFGFGYFLAGLYWIVAAFLVDPGAHLVFVWLPLIILPAGLALILSAVFVVFFRFWRSGPSRLLLFAAAFMAAEWIRGELFGLGGLPWNLPAMVWSPGGAMSQSASIWGVYGLSLLTVLAFVTPAALSDQGGGRAGGPAAALIAAVACGALWGWGAQRLSAPPQPPTGLTVRLVEAGTPQNRKFDPGVGAEMVRRFIELTGEDGPSAADIVIWPEGALPYYLFEWPDALEAITEPLGARRLIVGLARRERVGEADERSYNSLAVLDAESARTGPSALYDKHRLVPFGEFTPFRELAGLLGVKTLQALAAGGFDAGPLPASVRAEGVPAFGPLICYEAIFPGLSPRGGDRPLWLVNISNDAWFGGLTGPHQHAAQARYRSIEEGLPMARVAAGGATGIVDAHGRWTVTGRPADPAASGPDPEGWRSSVAEGEMPPALAPTLFGRWRHGFFFAMLAATILAAWALSRSARSGGA
jgi:apolipoprotein N-acyltransferase